MESRHPLVAAFAAHLATRASPHTRNAYVRDVEQLALQAAAGASPVALERITGSHLRRFLSTLHGRGLSGRTLARMLSSWRGFFKYLAEEGKVKSDPCVGLRPPRSPKKLPDALSPDEATRLVGIEGDAPLALRDRAMLELFYSSGLRLSELAGLTIDRVDWTSGEVRVWGKGAKERIVPVGEPAMRALERWREARAGLAAPGSNALFVSQQGAPISVRSIQMRMKAWAIKQGLPRHVHPHMLRHSFASHVLQSSGDLRAVQEMLGHASIASTQVYTHLDFQYLSKVYDAAHPRAKKKA
ncbi:MAG: tyrosine recombinase XerC [Betaproteobacteria bacterium]|nr:tyrosine recombinase XerC [Betaproteobacteria bacterium]